MGPTFFRTDMLLDDKVAPQYRHARLPDPPGTGSTAVCSHSLWTLLLVFAGCRLSIEEPGACIDDSGFGATFPAVTWQDAALSLVCLQGSGNMGDIAGWSSILMWQLAAANTVAELRWDTPVLEAIEISLPVESRARTTSWWYIKKTKSFLTGYIYRQQGKPSLIFIAALK